MKRTLAAGLFFLACAGNLARVEVKDRAFRVEVARTDEERTLGLMFRSNIPEDGGMIFVFPDEKVRSFWMRNTAIPLDIAFIDAEGKVVSVDTMYPFTDDSHVSAGPAARALEVRAGALSGVRPGDTVRMRIPGEGP